jgi:hypothetical protein
MEQQVYLEITVPMKVVPPTAVIIPPMLHIHVSPGGGTKGHSLSPTFLPLKLHEWEWAQVTVAAYTANLV